jgi:hypothetical protein
VVTLAIRSRTPAGRWARRAIAALEVRTVHHHRTVGRLTEAAQATADAFGPGPGLDAAAGTPVLVARLVALDDGSLWHPGERLRSYVDASVQAVLAGLLAGHVAERTGSSPLAVLEAAAHADPTSRALLIALAQALLEAGRAGDAVPVARRAHRLQSACLTSERLLLRALREDPDADPDAPEMALARLDLTDRTCVAPFSVLSTGWAGESFACMCPAWVPYSIGNVHDAGSAEALWNSDTAREIRRSIIDGDYSYCSRIHCTFIAADLLPRREEIADAALRAAIEQGITTAPPPTLVELNHDPTCNLACPSCRTEIVAADKGARGRDARTEERVLLPLLREVQGMTYISGGGEPFSSPHYRSILGAINERDFPWLKVDLISNGLLITPERWATLPDLPASLARLAISVDAATAETYERLRPPGRWDTLRRNLDFVADLRRRGEVPHLRLNFVVQQANFREIPAFLTLGREVGADELWFQRVTNYGTYDEASFAEVDVTAADHPDHADLLAILRLPELAAPDVDIGMLLPLLPELAASESQAWHREAMNHTERVLRSVVD